MAATAVVQAAGQFHDGVVIALARVPEHVLDDPGALHARNDMLDGDPCFGNHPVDDFFGHGEFLAARFFLGLHHNGPGRGIALKARVLEQYGVGWEFKGALVGQDLVMGFPRHSGAQVSHGVGPSVNDQVVFKGVGFLFAAVIGFLAFVFGRPLGLAFRAVNDEFPDGRGFELAFCRNGVPCGQCARHPQRLLQDGAQT